MEHGNNWCVSVWGGITFKLFIRANSKREMYEKLKDFLYSVDLNDDLEIFEEDNRRDWWKIRCNGTYMYEWPRLTPERAIENTISALDTKMETIRYGSYTDDVEDVEVVGMDPFVNPKRLFDPNKPSDDPLTIKDFIWKKELESSEEWERRFQDALGSYYAGDDYPNFKYPYDLLEYIMEDLDADDFENWRRNY